MNKKLLITAIIIALAALAVGGAYYFDRSGLSLPGRQNHQKPFAVEKKDLAFTELPQGLPQELPIESGTTTVQNYEATTTDGRVQSTRELTTNLALAAGVKQYADFFVAQGWTEVPVENQTEGTVTALLRKKSDVVLITGRENATTKQKTVEITLTAASRPN